MYAKVAAECINAWCEKAFAKDEKFGENPTKLASTMANGPMIDAFDHEGGGTHKYIPADKLTTDLGMRIGAGVYGYWRMKDGSYLLRTCDGPLAWWSGNAEDAAHWGVTGSPDD